MQKPVGDCLDTFKQFRHILHMHAQDAVQGILIRRLGTALT